MNSRRHSQYRKSVYARRRLRVILITVSVVIAVLLLLFLIVGNLLGNRVERDRNEEESRKESETTTGHITVLANAPAIQASPVYLVNQEGAPITSLRSQIDGFSQANPAVTIPLDKADGELLYRSEVATALGCRSIRSGSQNLENLLAYPLSNDCYVSVSFTLPECAEEDVLIRSAKLAASASLVGEAFRAGAHDVLLFAPDADPQQVDELISFAQGIRELDSSSVIGLTIPASIMTASNRDALIERLASAFNYLTLDLTDFGEEDPVSFVSQGLTDMLSPLLRYQMRVILPTVTEEQSNSLLSILTSKSIYAWQFEYQ